MHKPAKLFLSLRALGAPANVIMLAVQGIFRGFKDTKTPVFFIGNFQELLFINHMITLVCISYIPFSSPSKYFVESQ
jgi:Na+-driven multidrug efflux pump